MTNFQSRLSQDSRRPFIQRHGRTLALSAAALVVLLGVISCGTVTRLGGRSSQLSRRQIHRLQGMRTVPRRTLPRLCDCRPRPPDGGGNEFPQRRLRIVPRTLQCSFGFRRRNTATVHVQAWPGAKGELRRPGCDRTGPIHRDDVFPMPFGRARPILAAQPSPGAGGRASWGPTATRRTRVPFTSAAELRFSRKTTPACDAMPNSAVPLSSSTRRSAKVAPSATFRTDRLIPNCFPCATPMPASNVIFNNRAEA